MATFEALGYPQDYAKPLHSVALAVITVADHRAKAAEARAEKTEAALREIVDEANDDGKFNAESVPIGVATIRNARAALQPEPATVSKNEKVQTEEGRNAPSSVTLEKGGG